jgi:hypothetical protein
MSFGGPSKTCPRCNTVLPAQATFCGTCGLQFPASTPSAPPAGNYGSAPYGAPGAPGSFPPSAQQGYPPPAGQPGYPPPGSAPAYPGGYPPPGQPMYGGYSAAPVAAPPKKGGAGKAIVLVLVLVVLVGGGAAAWFLYLSPGHTGSPLFDRHGLPSNVPLPNNVTFQLKKTFTSTDPDTKITVSADAWGWGVNGSDAATVQKFYQDNLSKNGWTKIHAFDGDQGQKDVSACLSNQALIIGASNSKLQATDENGKVTDTITAPSGGSALITELTSTPVVVQLFCSSSPVIPTP